MPECLRGVFTTRRYVYLTLPHTIDLIKLIFLVMKNVIKTTATDLKSNKNTHT